MNGRTRTPCLPPSSAFFFSEHDPRDRCAPDDLSRRVTSERGSVTAEFAAVVPAVLLILAFCLGAVQLLGQQLRATDAAGIAARSLARGDPEALARSRVEAAIGPAVLSSTREGAFVCVTVSSVAAFAPVALAGLTVRGRGCALAG